MIKSSPSVSTISQPASQSTNCSPSQPHQSCSLPQQTSSIPPQQQINSYAQQLASLGQSQQLQYPSSARYYSSSPQQAISPPFMSPARFQNASPGGMPRFAYPYSANVSPSKSSGSSGSNSREMKREMAHRMRLRIQQEREEHEILRSQHSADPEKECIRRNIQQRIRLRMIRKGQVPPNPTLEELQMCGLQPISMSSPYQQYYRMQSPGGMMRPGMYSPTSPHMPYSPYSYQQNQMPIMYPPLSSQFQALASQIQVSSTLPSASASPLSLQQIPQNLSNYSSKNGQIVEYPDSNAPTSLPSPLSIPVDSNGAIIDVNSYFDTSEISKFASPSIVPNLHPHSEPFMLPEREYPPSTFGSFFGEDFALE